MKNKNLIIALIAVAIVVVGAITFIAFNKKAPAQVEQAPSEDQVTTIKPEDIGLSLVESSNNQKVTLEIANTKDVSSLDYELSYTAKVLVSGVLQDVPRGAIGTINIKQAGKPVSQDITLGTCSDVCHYDQNISGIKVVLKVTKTDGSIAQVEKSLDSNQ
jgi:hypothetical protein